jgi:hypothetical protein
VLLTIASASLAFAAEMRTMRYKPSTAEQTVEWQNELRPKLFKLLKLDDLVPVLRFSDHLDIWFVFQKGAHTFAVKDVVVCDQDFDGHILFFLHMKYGI